MSRDVDTKHNATLPPIRISAATKERLQRRADDQHRTMSDHVRFLIAQDLSDGKPPLYAIDGGEAA